MIVVQYYGADILRVYNNKQNVRYHYYYYYYCVYVDTYYMTYSVDTRLSLVAGFVYKRHSCSCTAMSVFGEPYSSCKGIYGIYLCIPNFVLKKKKTRLLGRYCSKTLRIVIIHLARSYTQTRHGARVYYILIRTIL